MPALQFRASTRQGKTLSDMFLSQPPCTSLEAIIWEERDETQEYVGRTTTLNDPLIKCSDGLTLGMVHEHLGKMFSEHSDVAAIKLTTI